MSRLPAFSLLTARALLPRVFGRAEFGLLLITLLYTAGGYYIARKYGVGEQFSFFLYGSTTTLVTFFLALAFITGRIVYIMVAIRPDRLTRFILTDFRAFLTGRDRILRAIPVLLMFLVFMSAFTSMKSIIPVLHPFSWDPAFVAWDRLLHGGRDPWRILHPLIGHPPLTSAINFIYNMWFFFMFAALYWQLFAVSRPQLRMQFFYSFFLAWIIIGTLAATVFSSVGPCFLQPLYGNDYYAPLMDYLNKVSETVPVWSLNAQALLLATYQESKLGLGGGISAMPSMHIAVSFIIAMTGWRTNKGAGIAGTAFLLVIMVGSVHLGWHYAIDGYVALLMVWPIWRISGWLTGRFVSESPQGSAPVVPAGSAA